jgi:hypothetical protein
LAPAVNLPVLAAEIVKAPVPPTLLAGADEVIEVMDPLRMRPT